MKPDSTRPRPAQRFATALVLTTCAVVAAHAGTLEDELGRSEVRVRSGAYPFAPGRTVVDIALPERLERLGYERVRDRPSAPGEFFWGNRTFWIYRKEHRLRGRDFDAALFGLRLRESDGMIEGWVEPDGTEHALDRVGSLWLEPETLSEDLAGDRARRIVIAWPDMPEKLWRAVLAAEDARFFSHPGVDARSVARAFIANVKSGGVSQGGSTITQQLVKNRDLTPKRTLGRKASEAVRSLALEAEHDKEDILAAYLNHVYLGHVGGLAVHGVGTASQAYFGKDVSALTLSEVALLAAMIQGPNRLSPVRHPERARVRRDWVLDRLLELEWATPAAVASAQAAPIRVTPSRPPGPAAPHFLGWVSSYVEECAPRWVERGRGTVVETTLDPWLQAEAEHLVARWLKRLRRDYRSLSKLPLQAALVALDADTGAVLAHVGGDPAADRHGIDRVRRARRQPGSTVKPLVLLEAFERCGARGPIHPATRVADEPLTWELPSGPWRPVNSDGKFRGVVDVRTATARSLNVPFVRLARHCDPEHVAGRFRSLGLDLPEEVPPSFVLGAVEVSPLELAQAYTVLATPGRVTTAFPAYRVERPGGRRLHVERARLQKVVEPSTAWLVRDLLRDAASDGTAAVASVRALDVAAKTGTSSDRRDAWLAGHAGGIVAVVWVGLDEGGRLGLSGASAAGPLWRDFMARAVMARPPRTLEQPAEIVSRRIDPATGLLVGGFNAGAREELFRRTALPARKRFWRRDEPVPVIR